MRIGLVSDTHLPRFGKALPRALVQGLRRHPVDWILHAGDFTAPEVADWFRALAPFAAVAGNNDGPDLVDQFGRRRILELAGVRIGLVHGDGARGTTLSRVRATFAPGEVDVVVFGHSHQPFCTFEEGRWLINPGSPSDKRQQLTYSFGVLTIADGRIQPQIFTYPDRNVVPSPYGELAIPGELPGPAPP